MDRDTAIARMQEKLGFRTDLVTPCTNALQDAQDELEKATLLPWFLLQEDVSFVITPPVPAVATPLEVTLPTGYIEDSDPQEGGIRYQQTKPGTSVFLTRMDMTEAERWFFGQRQAFWDGNVVVIEGQDTQFTAGTPLAYVIRKTTARFYPGPDKVYNLTWSYYAHDQRLDGSNLTNQWLTFAPWLLIGNAGMLVAMSRRDKEAIEIFSELAKAANNDFLAEQITREVAGRSVVMGRGL